MKLPRQKWTDHKFNLGLDPGWVYNVLRRLEDTELRLNSYTKDLSEEQLQMKPNGAWSIKEHIGHLIDLEPLHEKRLKEFELFLPELTMADMSNARTEKADHNDTPLRTLLDEFKKGRKSFIETYKSLPEKCLYHEAMHPRLKVMMKPVDLLFFVAEHDDHHITSIFEIRELIE